MYADQKPCVVCGSAVTLRAHTAPRPGTDPDGPVDDRVCSNADCPTNSDEADAPRA